MIKKYRPSNGAEGDYFMSRFCDKCKYDDVDKEIYCDILTRTLAYSEDDPEYPEEWQYKNGDPICTKFEKKED